MRHGRYGTGIEVSVLPLRLKLVGICIVPWLTGENFKFLFSPFNRNNNKVILRNADGSIAIDFNAEKVYNDLGYDNAKANTNIPKFTIQNQAETWEFMSKINSLIP